MFRSYVKLALRNLYKNKLYAAINIVGLSVAIAICITGYLNYQFSQSYDNFQKNRDNLYAVHSFKVLNGKRQDWSSVPLPLAPTLANDVAGVQRFSRLKFARGNLRYGDNVFNETFHCVDPDFLEMFSFELMQGQATLLQDKLSLAMSDELAEKYFGSADPIGQQVQITVGDAVYPFTVAGVFKRVPTNSTLQFDILLPLDNHFDFYQYDRQDWKSYSQVTVIQVPESGHLPTIQQELERYLPIANEANPDWELAGLFIEPFANIPKIARELRGDPYFKMPDSAIVAPSIIALLVLLLACFNYVNTAVAFAGRRLKEIGIRKVVGGVRRQLVTQHLVENLVICFAALLLGMGLAEVFVPAYDALWPHMDLSMSYSENPELMLFLIILLPLTAVAAGAYPAFYISAFRPVTIFRGKQKLGGTNGLIRVLLTFQFAFSITAIVSGLVFSLNAEYIRTAELGFDREQVMVVPVRGEADYNVLQPLLQANRDVVSVGGSRSLVGRSWRTVEIEREQQKGEVAMYEIGEAYLGTIGHQLLAGRQLDWQLQADMDEGLLVNETLVREYAWQEPIGKYLKVKLEEGEKEYRIVGVLQDFRTNGFWRPVRPVIMALTEPARYRYLTLLIADGRLPQVAEFVQQQWATLFPSRPYDGFFLETTLAEELEVTRSIEQLFSYIAIISVMIAALGLFALVSLNIAKRTKEIGVRKILGASVGRIGQLISKEFVLLLSLGFVLALPLGYASTDMLLSSIYAYHVGFNPVPFVQAGALMFLVAFVTVALHVYRASIANPALALRDE